MKDETGVTNAGKLRWSLSAVLLISVIIAFFDRMNITYAIPKIAQDYGWTAKQVGTYGGLLMSIFYVAYGFANIFLSPLGEKWGPRKSLMLIVVLFSLFTAIQSPLGLILPAFIAARVGLGLSEGIHFPMNNTITKKWFPTHERSRANSIWISGLFLSMILAPFVVVPIIEHWGWQTMFLVLGIMGMLITLPLLYFFIYDTPEQHPRASREEIEYINAGVEQDEEIEEKFWKSVKSFMKKDTFWLALLGGIFNNMVAYGLLSWLPTFFTEGKGLEFSNLMYATSIPYVFSIFGIALWSYVGDKTNRRATLAGIGFIITGIIAYFATTAETVVMAVALFSVTIFVKVSYASNEFAIVQRIVPRNRIATGVGFYNGVAMILGGGLGPVVVGSVVSATGDYTMGLLSLVVLSFVAGAILLVLGWRLKY